MSAELNRPWSGTVPDTWVRRLILIAVGAGTDALISILLESISLDWRGDALSRLIVVTNVEPEMGFARRFAIAKTSVPSRIVRPVVTSE